MELGRCVGIATPHVEACILGRIGIPVGPSFVEDALFENLKDESVLRTIALDIRKCIGEEPLEIDMMPWTVIVDGVSKWLVP